MAQSDGQDPQALADAKATIRELRGLIGDAGRAVQTLRAETRKAEEAAAAQVREHEERLRAEFSKGLVEMTESLGEIQSLAEAKILRKFEALLKMTMNLPSEFQAPGLRTVEDLVNLSVNPDTAPHAAVHKMFQPLPPHQLARAAKAHRKSRKGR